MGSFGERLRREREMRKVTLDEMAAATKIGTRSLKALEDEQFGKLPGGIFNKGFVRAYAKFLGINEEQAVADYLAAAGEEESQTSEIDVSQLLAARHDEEKKVRSKELESINDSSKGFPWAAIVAIAVIVAASAGGWELYTRYKANAEQKAAQAQQEADLQRQAAEQRQQQAAPIVSTPTTRTTPDSLTQQPVAVAATPETNAVSSPVQAAPSFSESVSQSADGGFVLLIRAKQDAWVSIKADGKSVMSGILTASAEKTVHARGNVVLKTGNAGGVEIALNGKVLPAIGRDAEVRTVVVTPEGIQQ